MKVLLVGSEGFLGGWVKKLLLKDNEHELVEIRGKNDLDITNIEKLDKFFINHKPQAVINCAAFVGGISYGYKFPAKMLYENSKMALNLYQISNSNKVSVLVNPISNCAYPGHLNTYKEDNFFDGPPHESVYNYAMSKRMCVDLGNSFFNEYNFTSANVILSNMYGPEDHFDIERSHALGALVKKISDAKMNNESSVEIWGTGNPIREWLYVHDGARALLKSLNLKSGHYFFNIGVKKGISIIDLANIIKEKVGWKGKFSFNLDKPDGVLEKKVDGIKGSQLLEWEPEFELEYGIEKTINWYKETHGR
ncbi:NAD-dependent epimerase/dehydratase family protein [Acidimicrobiaceae bacterium]|nr:NAD-dependent epimerase/dehydratase family protein [Acidimicrobiaceae bacterium]